MDLPPNSCSLIVEFESTTKVQVSSISWQLMIQLFCCIGKHPKCHLGSTSVSIISFRSLYSCQQRVTAAIDRDLKN